MFREIYPDQPSYKQEALVSAIINETYEAHNAVADVQSLQKLYIAAKVSDNVFFGHSFSTSWGLKVLRFKQMASENIDTLQPLVARKVVSKAMADKVGNSGLKLCHLQLAFTRGGKEGLTSLLSEKENGKVRVTANKRVLSNITDYFESL